MPLAKRGFDITCVELGADLAAVAKQRLASYPTVRVIQADFDTWTPPRQHFDLVFAATAPPGSSWPRPDEIAEEGLEHDSGGIFRRITVRTFDWETVYDADSYIDLLNTFSGHIAMRPLQRDRLYGEIRQRLARRPDGQLRRHWGAALEIGQLST